MAGIFNNNFWSMIFGILAGNPTATSNYISNQSRDNALNSLSNGDLSAEDFLGQAAKNGWTMTPEQESYLASMLSNQRTNEARDYETMMANTDLLRAAQQLGTLGLGPSNVLQTGGSAVRNVAAASTPALNNANQRYDRMSTLANSLIGMAGRMAGAGIYGSALSSVKKAAADQAALASHSAKVIRHYDKMGELTGETEITGVRSKRAGDLL